MKADALEAIWERIKDGCYTPDAIVKCSECGHRIFNLNTDQVNEYLQRLVDDGRAEWRRRGGKTYQQRGAMEILCVPRDLPSGEAFVAAHDSAEETVDEICDAILERLEDVKEDDVRNLLALRSPKREFTQPASAVSGDNNVAQEEFFAA